MKKAKKFIDKNSTKIILFLIFLSMLLLNFLTPYIADDINYKYIWGTNNRVHNLLDIAVSQYNHYLTWGGRSVAHSIAQFFLIFPKWLFNIMNALCYTTIIYLIYNLATNKKHRFLLILIHLLIYFIVPYFGEDFLWLIGSCNYAWTLLIMLLFLSTYEKNNKKDNTIRIILMFLFGIISGWTNENTAIGVFTIVLLLIIEEKLNKEKIQKWKISGLVGNLIGIIILILAPGNYVRKSITESNSNFFITILKRFIDCTISLFNNAWPLLILLLILYSYYIYKKRKPNVKSYNYIAGSLISIYAMILSPQFPERAWVGIICFLIISIIILLDKVLEEERLVKFICIDIIIVLLCCFFVDYYHLAVDLMNYDKVLNYRKTYIKNHKDKKTFKFKGYEINNKKSPIHGYDLTNDKNNWLNQAQAKKYGVKYIIGY